MRDSNVAITNRMQQRGSGLWFALVIILLLVFAYLWWDASNTRDEALRAQQTAENNETNTKKALNHIIDEYTDLSKAVGFLSKSITLKGVELRGRPGPIVVTDAKALRGHIQKDGTVAGAEGQEPSKGTLGTLIDEAVLKFTREGRVHATKIGEEKVVDYSALSEEFKTRLDEFRSKWGSNDVLANRPIAPVDTDDDAAMQEYRDALKAYEETLAQYDAELRELTEAQGWKDYSETIRAPGQWQDPTNETVAVSYLTFPEGGEATVETMLGLLPGMVRGLKDETKAIATAYADKVQQLTADNKAKQASLDQSNEALAREQENFTTELNRITQDLATAESKISALTDEKNQAQNQLQEAKDQHQVAVTVLERDRDRYSEGLANMKERRELRKRRNLAKGNIVAVSQTLGTGTMNIGRADRVYVGMTFEVRGMDRGGNSYSKGKVMVYEVAGKHAANFRIKGQSVPITGGDTLHNPLYNPTDPIHVYVFGKLDKWPQTMLKQRLEPLGVVLQDAMDGKTDYVVVPDSMSEKPSVKTGEEDEGDDEAAPAISPYRQLERRARRFGAVVVHESLFDAFLKF